MGALGQVGFGRVAAVRRVPVTPDNLDYDDGLYGHGVSMPEEHYEINLVDALRPEVINALDSFGERRLTQTLRVNAAAKIKLTRGVPPVQLPREMIDALIGSNSENTRSHRPHRSGAGDAGEERVREDYAGGRARGYDCDTHAR